MEITITGTPKEIYEFLVGNQKPSQTESFLYVKKFPQGTTLGFPLSAKAWCNSELKVRALDSIADNNRRGQNPDSLREQSTDLPTSESLTAQDNSKSNQRIYGLPIIRGNWCTSDLKRRVFS